MAIDAPTVNRLESNAESFSTPAFCIVRWPKSHIFVFLNKVRAGWLINISSDTRATSAYLVSCLSCLVVLVSVHCCCFRDCDSHPSFRSTSVLVCSFVEICRVFMSSFSEEPREEVAVVSCYNYAWFSSVSTVLSRLWTVRCVVLMARWDWWAIFFLIPFFFDRVWLVTAVSILDQSRRIFHHVIRGSLLVLYNDHTRRLESVCPSDLLSHAWKTMADHRLQLFIVQSFSSLSFIMLSSQHIVYCFMTLSSQQSLCTPAFYIHSFCS
jgi:hypothetical protein